jgi:hypothetical protein
MFKPLVKCRAPVVAPIILAAAVGFLATLPTYATGGDTVADRVFGQGGSFTTNTNTCGIGIVNASTLCSPYGVAMDSAGNLYVVDGQNQRVLEYDTPLTTDTVADRVFGQGGNFTTNTCNLGGLSASSLCNPYGVTVDSAGNLYVVDGANQRVLEYDTPLTTDTIADRVFGQGGSFTTGNCSQGAGGLCAPFGVTVAAGNLYVTDRNNHRVLEYDTPLTTDTVADQVFGQGGSFTTNDCNPGGVSAASLCNPKGVAADAAGNIYVTDESNNRVLEFDTPSTSDTVPDEVFGQGGSFTSNSCNLGGVSASSLCGPEAVTVDSAGNLYVADIVNHRVLEHDDPLATDTVADRVFGQGGSFTDNGCNLGGISAGSLCAPYGVSVDGDGNLYVADNQNHRVLEYDCPLDACIDLEVSTASVSSPPSAEAGSAFSVTTDATVHNNGPATPVNADVQVTLNVPADCSVAGGNSVTLQDQALAVSVATAIPQQTFSVTCWQDSLHTISTTATVIEDEAGLVEGNPANNTLTSADDMTDVTSHPTPGEIHGTKWDDQDGNGVRNGEPGLIGVQICVYGLVPPDETGALVSCDTTDVNGDYEFLNLAPDYYRVAEVVPPGRSQTYPANGQSHFPQVDPSEIVTGLDFGNDAIPPGTVQGTKFNDTNGNGVQNGGELGVSGISICIHPSGLCTTTNSSGDYSFTVAPGNHTVYEQLPPGSLNTTPINVPVNVTSGGTVNGVNFGNRIPVPPPPEVTVESNWSYNGIPIVGGGARTYTKDVTDHCENTIPPTPFQVKLVITSSGGSSTSQMMTDTGSEIWSATVTPPSGGLNTLRFYVDCPPDTADFPEDHEPPPPIAAEDEIQEGGNIYVDPSGTILDECTGLPLDGATVTLIRESPPGSDNFVEPATSSHIPADNPEITAADGAYGWVVTPGIYRVRAEKAGYITKESAELTIPPAVTDLNLTLGSATDGDCDGVANASDLDDDNDEVFDVAEGPCGGNTLNAALQPERLDTPGDDDGDTLVNEALPSPASDGFDCDGDGWTGSQENLIFSAGTTASDQDPCGGNGWASDLAANNMLNIADINSVLSPARPDDGHGTFNKFNHPLDDDGDTVVDPLMARWNLQNTPADGPATLINIADLNSLLTGAVGSPARPPMFGGQQAFFTNGGVCPWPP